MKTVYTFCIGFFVSQTMYSQSLFGKATKSVYALYGRHFQTTYIIDSGQGNLVGRKYNESVEFGLNVSFSLDDSWMISTGMNCHLFLLGEITYGVSGPVPSDITDPFVHKYARGIDYVSSYTFGIPLKLRYNLFKSEKSIFFISAGPMIGFYFPARDGMAGSAIQRNNGTYTQLYWVTRRFRNYKTNNSLSISYPQLEWDFDVELKRRFKKYGAVGLGIKTHLGTKRLEKSTFVIFPDEPNYRSKGHFTLNRSYIGIYGSFTFGKNPAK